MEYYSAIKMNEIMSVLATWVELEAIILSETAQKQKVKYPGRSSLINFLSQVIGLVRKEAIRSLKREESI